MVCLNDLEVNKGHFESQPIVAYIIVKYRNGTVVTGFNESLKFSTYFQAFCFHSDAVVAEFNEFNAVVAEFNEFNE